MLTEFTIPEILSLLGVVQAAYILVYMLARSGSVASAIIPSILFVFLGAGFTLDAAERRWAENFANYEALQWFFWFTTLPAGIALLHQIATVPQKPKLTFSAFFIVVPLSFMPLAFGAEVNAVYIISLILECFCMFFVWARRDTLEKLHDSIVFGKERFWLVMALLVLQTVMLAVLFAYINNLLTAEEWKWIRNILGIAFAYIAATSLFRIYPQAIILRKEVQQVSFSDAENRLFERLEALLHVEKIYQDASYGRSELSRELNTGEANLSRLVNAKYSKTIPQLLNVLRVKDAQQLLRNPGISVQNVFEESGFNSLTTFNRVFKELTGETPTQYRMRATPEKSI